MQDETLSRYDTLLQRLKSNKEKFNERSDRRSERFNKREERLGKINERRTQPAEEYAVVERTIYWFLNCICRFQNGKHQENDDYYHQ